MSTAASLSTLRDSPLLQLCFEIMSELSGFHSAAFLASEVNERVAERNKKKKNDKDDDGKPGSESTTKASFFGPIHGLTRPVTAPEVRTAILSDIRHRRSSSLFRHFWHRFCVTPAEHESLCSTLILKRYRDRGLSLITSPVLVWFLPAAAAVNFLEVKASKIPHAGLGLFLRKDCPGFPRGGVLSEYLGERLDAESENDDDDDHNSNNKKNKKKKKNKTKSDLRQRQLHYSVTLRDGSLICGADTDGRPLCPAAVANDNGVAKRNVVMQEFWTSSSSSSAAAAASSSSASSVQGKVFLVAVRDLAPGEEIYCCYGAEYWGAEKYSDIAVVKIEKGGAVASKASSTKATESSSSSSSSSSGRVPLWQRRQMEQERKLAEKAPQQADDEESSSSPSGGTRRSRSGNVNSTKATAAAAAVAAASSDDYTCSSCSELVPRRLQLVHPSLCTGSSSYAFSYTVYKKFSSCLPQNEFTTIIRDAAATDGLVGDSVEAERQDWCLGRAVAFAAWNDCMTHAVMDGGGDHDYGTKKNDDPCVAKFPTSSAATLDEQSRATYFPLLKDCERIQSPESMLLDN